MTLRIKHHAENLVKLLTSPRLVLFLMIIILAACIAGLFVPQISERSPSYFDAMQKSHIYTYRLISRLQLYKVYTSYWFFTAILLLSASLFATLYRIGKRIIKTNHIQKQCSESIAQAYVPEDLIQTTNKRKYKLAFCRSLTSCNAIGSHQYIFAKNHLGRWASFVFHSGLMMIIIAALIMLGFQKRGFIQLIEHDTFDGQSNEFLVENNGVLADDFKPKFKIHLAGFNHKYWENGNLKSLESYARIIREDKINPVHISVNNPLYFNGTRIYQSLDYGYALSFILKRQTGEEIVAHINIDRANKRSEYATGVTGFPKTYYVFRIKFLPDINMSEFRLNNPIVHLNITNGFKTAFKGLLIPGDSIRLNNDVLYFRGVRYWSGLIFEKNPGSILIFAGFTVLALGASLLYFMPYREIRVFFNPETGNYDITCTTNTSRILFKEELDDLRSEINAINKKIESPSGPPPWTTEMSARSAMPL